MTNEDRLQQALSLTISDIEDLKAQIEKMKCCENCKLYYICRESGAKCADEYDYWECRE